MNAAEPMPRRELVTAATSGQSRVVPIGTIGPPTSSAPVSSMTASVRDT